MGFDKPLNLISSISADQQISPSKKWKLNVVRKWPLKEIFIVNEEQNVTIKIANGDSALWRQQ